MRFEESYVDSPTVSDTDSPADNEPAVIELVITSPDAVPNLPDISEFWPDAPHKVGPPADHYEPEGADPVRTDPAWVPRGSQRPTVELHLAETRTRRASRKPILVLAAVILAAAGLAWYATRPTEPTAGPVLTVPSATGPAEDPAGQPPVSIETTPPITPAPDAATLELADGTTALAVRIGDTGDNWYQVSSPIGSGITTRTEEQGDTVRVFVDDHTEPGTAEVNVVLSAEVTWSFRMSGGVRTAAVDLTGAKVGRIDLIGGAAEIDLALPRQDAVVPISMTGGVRDWRVSTGGHVEAVLKEGAGVVELYGDRKQGVNKGSRFTAGDGDGGVDLVAEKGVGTLIVAEGRDGGTISE
ncbi:hypothetical protein Q0Z83_063410 [Actinoplanes sichuanensis]|uniref:Adhesin domain-containing protein n=1 Tax=Actinoplanes sichuanensis TaxID=512349 RepID=A0ABW3ZZT9_9ACTN|nr:hypothetical protein [Actinoplanes sichuanensis]BEL08150.1 hypothetical protein Q0Z83_063410 [Actinoplanes sichuanensis]